MQEITVKIQLDPAGNIASVGSNCANKHILVGLLFEAAQAMAVQKAEPQGIQVPAPELANILNGRPR